MSPLKLAFLVEGDRDKAFVEALVPRVLGVHVELRVVRVGGKAAFPSTFFEAAKFVESGYAAVFLLVDADTELPDEIEQQRQRLAEIFRRYGIEDRVRIIMAVPMLEAWLLAAYHDHPERSTNPKRDLTRRAGAEVGADVGALAAALPIDVARRRSPSFNRFVLALEGVVPRKARRAS